ncbi:MAG: hypothetical protein ACOZQL_14175 [Myxococcota bacterium]
MAFTWQVSSSYIKSLGAALRVLGHTQRVLEGVGPGSRTALTDPLKASWWPGEVLVDTVTVLGMDAAKEVSIRASRDGMGPLVRPLAAVVLTLTRHPQEAMLSRLGTFVSAGVKGVSTAFVPNGRGNGGRVSMRFPEPVPQVMASVWTGMFDVGFTLARGGRVVSEQLEPTTHHFDVEW